MQTKVERPVSVVRPFSINGKQMCSNCENYEKISGMMGLCKWCTKHKRTSTVIEVTQQPVVLGGGEAHELNDDEAPSPTSSSSTVSVELSQEGQRDESIEFSQEGQRWDISQNEAQDEVQHRETPPPRLSSSPIWRFSAAQPSPTWRFLDEELDSD